MSVAENLIYANDTNQQPSEKVAASRSDVIPTDKVQFLLNVPGLEVHRSWETTIPERQMVNESILRAIIAKEPNPWKVEKIDSATEPVEEVKVTRFVLPPMKKSSFETISEIAEDEHQKARLEARARAIKDFDPIRYQIEYNIQRDAHFESMLAPLNNPEPEVEEQAEEQFVEDVDYSPLMFEKLLG